MRNVKYLYPVLLLAVAAVAVTASIGIINSKPLFFIITVWLSALLVTGLFTFLMLGYQRIVARIRTSNERLAEIKFLQERRYEQLRHRLDFLADNVRLLHRNAQRPHLLAGDVQGSPEVSKALTEIEHLSARMQRFERRVLGKIENEQWVNDMRSKQLAESLNDSQYKCAQILDQAFSERDK